jgi:hypothetical protein
MAYLEVVHKNNDKSLVYYDPQKDPIKIKHKGAYTILYISNPNEGAFQRTIFALTNAIFMSETVLKIFEKERLELRVERYFDKIQNRFCVGITRTTNPPSPEKEEKNKTVRVTLADYFKFDNGHSYGEIESFYI